MNKFFPSVRISHVSKIVFSLILALAVLAAALPQPAAAQDEDCRTTYVVKEGDKTGRIAHLYKLRWREIAEANDLKVPTTLEEGMELCIPFADDDADDDNGEDNGKDKDDKDDDKKDPDEDALISVTITGNKVFLTTDNFSDDFTFLAKARPAGVGVGGWKRLGRISIDEDDREDNVFTLPDSLRSEIYISVCLKNQVNDNLYCRTAVNLGGSN